MLRQKLFSVISILALVLPTAYASAGTIVAPHQYAWSNNAGYINFASTTVNDSSLGGYAWSANAGWISFAPDQGGVLNDGAGNLSGSAWGTHLGWIDFSGVDIDADGIFSGTATGARVGTITFDCPTYCDVRTDWRAADDESESGGGGGGGGGGSSGSAGSSPTSESVVTALKSAAVTVASIVEDPVKSAFVKAIDIQKDGVLNILDFNVLMADWGAQGSSLADLNRDSVVDVFDFNLIMIYWNIHYTS